ncbi:MAG: DUF4157 domain-containing protein [Limnoraphis robusta]
MTQTFRAGQKSKSPKTSSPVQTSQFAKRPFAEEPVQQKAQQPNLQTILQRAERTGNPTSEKPIQKQEESIPNQTGLPDNLKAGIENLSGYSLDDVRVHYNSPKPAQLQALAYAQGTEIHVAPGQEKHLPHEAWHVVQQMQGRVKPTMQMKGVGVNDDVGLEKEADAMGGEALQRENAELIQNTETTQTTTEQQGESETSTKSIVNHRSPILSLMVQRKIMLGDRLLENDSKKLDIINCLIKTRVPINQLLGLDPALNNNEFFKNIIALSPDLQSKIIEVSNNKDSIYLNTITYTGNLVADEAINVILSIRTFQMLSQQLQDKLGEFYEAYKIQETDDARTEIYSRKLLTEILIGWYNLPETIHFSSIDEMFTTLIQQMNAEQIKKVPEVNSTYKSVEWRNDINYAKYSLIDELDESVEYLGSDQNADILINDSLTFTDKKEIINKLEFIKGIFVNKKLEELSQEYKNNKGFLEQIIKWSGDAIEESKKPKIQEKEQEAIKLKISAIKLLQGVVENLEIILEQMSLIFGLQGGANILLTEPWNTIEIIGEIVKSDLLKNLLFIVQSATAQEAGRDSKQEDRYPVATGTLYYTGVAPLVPLHTNVRDVLVEPDVLQKIKFIYHNLVKNLSGKDLNNYTRSYQGQIDTRNYIYIRHGDPVDSTTINTVYEQIQHSNLQPTLDNLKKLGEKLQFITEDIKPASKTAAYTVGTARNIDQMYQHLKAKFPKVSPKTPPLQTFKGPAKRRDRGKGQLSAMGNTNAAGYALVLAAIREHKWSADQDLISGKPFLESENEVKRTGWEWLHIRSAGLGGATDATNLVVGTHAANSHMIPFEHQVKELASLATEEKPLSVIWSAQNTAPGYAETISISWAAPDGLYNPDKRIFLPPVTWEDNMKAVFNPVNGQVFDKMQRDLDWQSIILLTPEAQKAITYLVTNKASIDISKFSVEEKKTTLTALSAVINMTQEQLENTIQVLLKYDNKNDVNIAAIWLKTNAQHIYQAIIKSYTN